jgi:hypothetical protein
MTTEDAQLLTRFEVDVRTVLGKMANLRIGSGRNYKRKRAG